MAEKKVEYYVIEVVASDTGKERRAAWSPHYGPDQKETIRSEFARFERDHKTAQSRVRLMAHYADGSPEEVPLSGL